MEGREQERKKGQGEEVANELRLSEGVVYLAGFCTMYRFYYHPESTRLRLSQVRSGVEKHCTGHLRNNLHKASEHGDELVSVRWIENIRKLLSIQSHTVGHCTCSYSLLSSISILFYVSIIPFLLLKWSPFCSARAPPYCFTCSIPHSFR